MTAPLSMPQFTPSLGFLGARSLHDVVPPQRGGVVLAANRVGVDVGGRAHRGVAEARGKGVMMSQAEFSRAYGISKRALQEWGQGGRQPDSAARAYLTVIAKESAAVRRALASE